MRAWVLLASVSVIMGCGDDGGGGTAVFDTSVAQDSVAVDTSVGQDGQTNDAAADSTAPVDTAVGQDSVPPADVVTGDKIAGTPCAADAECQSGICLASSLGSACTAPCDAEVDCDGFPIGMFCLPVRPGRSGCVPEGDPPPTSCAGHADCGYPLYCRPDGVGCDLPECLNDGDCPSDQQCEAAVRRCQPKVCTADLDCKHPALYCADDQTCAPPLCETDAECGASPAYCHPIQKECKTAATCEDEDGCFYNESCEGGHCLPDLCYAPCSGDRVCDPASGWCGAACSGSGQSTCDAGQACRPSGVCKPNDAPVAVAVEAATGGTVAIVSVGASVELRGESSIDPEGAALSYRWTVLDVPTASTLTAGSALGGDAAVAPLTADAAGRYVIGLIVTDDAGLDSIQTAVTIVAR